MRKISVEKKFEIKPERSERVTEVMRMFGVSIGRLKERIATHSCTIEVKEGDIVYITGPSGAGKSLLLKEIQTAVKEDERINIEDIELPSDRAVIDCVGQVSEIKKLEFRIENEEFRSPKSTMTAEAMALLSNVGLSDVFSMLNSPGKLSEGQKYRYRLAAALALIEGENPQHKVEGLPVRKYIFADEFCSSLDRITAAVIAYNVRKFAKRNGITFFLASAHEDILADLQPDVLVVKQLTGPAEVTYKKSE